MSWSARSEKTREKKYQAILDHAIELDRKGKTETFEGVARFLNRRGFRNNAGGLYAAHPRGVAKVVAMAFVWASETYGEPTAIPICNAFTKMSGEYAWSDE